MDSWRFSEDGEVVERECLLFEAGEYPDRGVTIAPEDLEAIAANTPGEIPVKIEHLSESPFDGALGVVTRIRAVGNQLWGTLRQPVEAWRFAQRAGARALSVALDVIGRRLVETSFVCRPRVAGAQVFRSDDGRWTMDDRSVVIGNQVDLDDGQLTVDEGNPAIVRRLSSIVHDKDKEEAMTSIRQFAEGLIQYLRGVTGGNPDLGEEARFAAERAALEAEKEAIRDRHVDQQIADLKRQGLLRGTDQAEGFARAILHFGATNVVQFGESEMPLSLLFTRFLEENGAVVPMGEFARADSNPGAGASDRLISMAREAAKRESVPYLAAFAQVSGAHPDLARAAREEGF